jgi:hypothetical protein
MMKDRPKAWKTNVFFLLDFGRQGGLGVHIDNAYHKIRKFVATMIVEVKDGNLTHLIQTLSPQMRLRCVCAAFALQ